MDLKLLPIASPLSAARPAAATRIASPAVAGDGFSNVLKNALQSVSTAQNESSHLQREVQMENPKVSLEETMVAIQKAQIGFQATLHVRNRMVQAYTDIMNMQV
jgi:flagellar hook-basal body complex protein FliE